MGSTSVDQLKSISEELRSNYKFSNKYNSKIEVCLKNFLRLNSSFAEEGVSEQHFNLEISEGITINGYIDRIIKGKNGGYLVLDYKTSKREKSKIELFQDSQMKGYVYAVHKLYHIPIEKITAGHYYPLSDNLVTVNYTAAQIRVHVKSVLDDVWKIRKAKKTDLKPMQNQFCNWCAYKSYCTEFNEGCVVQQRLSEATKRGGSK